MKVAINSSVHVLPADASATLARLDVDPSPIRTYRRSSRSLGRYLTHGQLDLDLARDAAPLAAFDNLTAHDFFSARIGCQTFGIYGMDLAALCIRPARR
jgi:hypothetical protein